MSNKIPGAAKKRITLHRKQHGRCAICDNGLRLRETGLEEPTLDHIIPRSKGGSNEIGNLRLVHRRCNEDRGNETETITIEIDGKKYYRDGRGILILVERIC